MLPFKLSKKCFPPKSVFWVRGVIIKGGLMNEYTYHSIQLTKHCFHCNPPLNLE